MLHAFTDKAGDNRRKHSGISDDSFFSLPFGRSLPLMTSPEALSAIEATELISDLELALMSAQQRFSISVPFVSGYIYPQPFSYRETAPKSQSIFQHEQQFQLAFEV